MSGNNSYSKSMNGIVSFDSGGTSIDGDVITTGEIDCTTLNATNINATGAFNTSYIFVDFMDKNIGSYITFISDVLFDYKLYVSNLWPSIGSNITVNGLLNIINGLKTGAIEGIDTNSLTKQLKIGQDNDYTTSINIGRQAITILGTVYPAIPPRTTFYAVGNDDICNKLYVDTVTGGTSILASTNIFTGTSNTFNNTVSLGGGYQFSGVNIDGIGSSGATYGILNNITTANVRIGHSMVSGVMAIANNKTSGDINIMNNAPSSGSFNIGDNCNGAVNLVRNSTTTGHVNIANTFKIFRNNFEYYTSISPTFNFFNNLLNSNTMNFGGNGYVNLCNNFVVSTDNFLYNNVNSSFNFCSNLLSTVTMNMGGAGIINLCNSIKISPNTIASTGINDTIELFNNINTGTVNLAKNITTGILNIGSFGLSGSTINIGNLGDINIGTTIVSKIISIGGAFRSTGLVKIWDNINITDNAIYSGGINNTINLFNNITTGTIKLGDGLTTGLLQFGGGKVKIGNQQISGYTEYNTTSANFTIPSTVNKEYFIVITGGSPLTITLPSSTAVIGQIINIRNRSNTTTHNVTTFPSTTIGIYPTQAGSARFQPAWSMPGSTAQRFYFDGSNWVGF
jgi:hypothetical protein